MVLIATFYSKDIFENTCRLIDTLIDNGCETSCKDLRLIMIIVYCGHAKKNRKLLAA
jgi:hypothetical protein